VKQIWIKLYVEILDDPKMGRLSNHLWRRAIELFLLAGKNGNDGLLPPVEEMAWVLRLSNDKLLEDLIGLAEVGVVHETPEGWVVTHFKDRQHSESYERVKRYRERESNAKSNEDVTGVPSTSTSSSDSSFEGGGMGEGAALAASFGDKAIQDAEQLYSKITDQVTFPPAWEGRYINALADLLYGHFERDIAKAAASAKPVFARYCNTRGKSGKTYSRTGTGWLDWWLSELAPKPVDGAPLSPVEKTKQMLEQKGDGNFSPPPADLTKPALKRPERRLRR
jgi:hypothetical protein